MTISVDRQIKDSCSIPGKKILSAKPNAALIDRLTN